MITFDDIARAHERIKAHARRTPVLTSRTVDERTGASVFFKCENFQRMGAFKFRGAFNALSQLGEEQKKTLVHIYETFRAEHEAELLAADRGAPDDQAVDASDEPAAESAGQPVG